MDLANSLPGLSRRVPQLDGLRGIAILMVLLYHYVAFAIQYGAPHFVTALLGPTNIGWSGVNLFFVLSGFLLGGILLDAQGSPHYFRAFYVRRICRIFPLYFTFLLAAFVACKALHSPTLVPWWYCSVFLQNIWMAVHNNFGGPFLTPTWTLAVEEQFYFALPALIYFTTRRQLYNILLGGIILAPIIRTLLYVMVRGSFTAAIVLLPCQMDSLLAGVLTAFVLRQASTWDFLQSHRRQLWTAMEVFTFFCLLFFLLTPGDNLLRDLLIYDFLALLFSCALILSLVDRQLASLLQAKWLMGLGNIAYGVYLIHTLGFSFATMLLPASPNRGLFAALLGLVITIPLAKISWEWFEKPIVRLGRRVAYGAQ